MANKRNCVQCGKLIEIPDISNFVISVKDYEAMTWQCSKHTLRKQLKPSKAVVKWGVALSALVGGVVLTTNWALDYAVEAYGNTGYLIFLWVIALGFFIWNLFD